MRVILVIRHMQVELLVIYAGRIASDMQVEILEIYAGRNTRDVCR